MQKEKISTVALRVEQDHQNIDQDIAALKMFLMKEAAPEDFGDWRLELIWQLRDFKNRLLRHFDLEEDGGFMAEVLHVAPQSERKITELKEEHDQIVMNLNEILQQLKNMEEKDSLNLENIRLGFNRIMATLREHENQEHILMQRAYLREYGGPA